MKKRILSFATIVSAVLLLFVFAIWQNQTDPENPSVSLPTESCDALVLVDASKKTQTDRYDLKQVETITEANEPYHPLLADVPTYLYCQENLTVHISRNVDLGENELCHYGLFEKNNKQFAVFYARINTTASAERLCHLLLCYRDYFPGLLFGKFDEATASLITDVCKFSSASVNGITYFYKNLSAKAHQESGTLSLHFEKAPRTLDLNKKMIALTFDDGPGPYTSQILQTLANHTAKATFFVNGSHVTEYPKTIQAIFNNNCEIGNHTNLHELFSHNTQGIIRKSIETTNKKVRNIIGIGTFVVRPPGGEILDRNQTNVKVGYPIIRWSLDTLDYTNNKTAVSLLETVQAHATHGDIILMHDTKAVTQEATNSILTYLISQEFQLVTVSELLEFSSIGTLNDRIYNNAYRS